MNSAETTSNLGHDLATRFASSQPSTSALTHFSSHRFPSAELVTCCSKPCSGEIPGSCASGETEGGSAWTRAGWSEMQCSEVASQLCAREMLSRAVRMGWTSRSNASVSAGGQQVFTSRPLSKPPERCPGTLAFLRLCVHLETEQMRPKERSRPTCCRTVNGHLALLAHERDLFDPEALLLLLQILFQFLHFRLAVFPLLLAHLAGLGIQDRGEFRCAGKDGQKVGEVRVFAKSVEEMFSGGVKHAVPGVPPL